MAWLTLASNTTSVEVVFGPEINHAMATDCATMTAYLESINLKGLICFPIKRMRSKSSGKLVAKALVACSVFIITLLFIMI